MGLKALFANAAVNTGKILETSTAWPKQCQPP